MQKKSRADVRNLKAHCIAALATTLLSACLGSSPSSTSATPHTSTSAFAVADATVQGPIGDAGQRGHALWDSWYRLEEVGYTEAEYFISGIARQQPDGAEADYTTRIIVRRPINAADFNGTVILDWVNVSAQFENAVDTLDSQAFFQDAGYAYVHVSAQEAGLCCLPGLTAQQWDPERYADLNHPGDDYAFDIFAQIAKAVRAPTGIDPMAGLGVERVLATGQSQSAAMLHDYVNNGYAASRAVDGILIHADTPSLYTPLGKGFAVSPLPVPVLTLLGEIEASPSEPPVDPNYMLWEVAGAAHQTFNVGYTQLFGAGPRALADAALISAAENEELRTIAGNYGEQLHPMLATCVIAGSTIPVRYAVDAAIHHLDNWVQTGTRPPEAQRYEFNGSLLALDSNGIARGGIRYPPVEHPVASYISTVCVLGGITLPFTPLQLQLMYPTHADYACKMLESTRQSVEAGFMMPFDARDMMMRVKAAENRWLTVGEADCPLDMYD